MSKVYVVCTDSEIFGISIVAVFNRLIDATEKKLSMQRKREDRTYRIAAMEMVEEEGL